ncbi:zinc-dependent dehydrogenase [Sediminicurvatus halobius]|uniref:Threonine dehydrogenase n=1 Tax=Sediminicurvatus halobius TaxID=2182432 RepID=A0A2U2MXF7_9GAMM|nr:zinc-dependent dehydrogenase [Spiribacter halobius]PWG61522.1 threonine dehydrogenase [Spiribacter halobius]UEX78001.1 zinc-dependent dehydrogenase [Spiribacter halobius]
MHAAVFHAPGDIRYAEVETPKAGDGELLLRVRAATICGTDLRIFHGRKTKGVRLPSIIGHEFAGEVVDVGSGVSGFAVGDGVAMDPVIPCLRCEYCKQGRENVCANRTAMGYEYDGAFAEYVRIPATGIASGNVYKLAPGTSWEQAALAEPLACCLNGQENAEVGLGDSVVVLGAGPIGLMHLQLARVAGARQVIVSEPNARRRELAASLGADAVVDPNADDLAASVRERCDGLGADVVIVAIGLPVLVNQALALVRKQGRVNLFAGFTAGENAAVDPNLIHYNEIRVSGASALTRRQYERSLRLIEAGVIAAGELVTHRLGLHDIGEALKLAESGDGVKVAIRDE